MQLQFRLPGEVIRKESAIPKGILACIMPTNKGMDEQEQKGVTAPRTEAARFPKPECL
ncbi:MAG: hypothetical protein ABJC55_01280 [Algoriphagus sp.]|tara:strand:- start:1407 stop:1580 length:174 start_codon:yes stop_codon:yes gene_type:complete